MPQSDRPETHAKTRWGFLEGFDEIQKGDNKYTLAALTRHKAEGLELAVRARWIAMALIAVVLVWLNPDVSVLYYLAILALISLNGWVMRRIGRVGQSRAELALITFDLVLMTVGMMLPNPFSPMEAPTAMLFRLGNFQYFFIILTVGTLAYSWRTVLAIAIWVAGLWGIGLTLVWWFSTPMPGLSEAAAQAFANYPFVADLMDPNSFDFRLRVQEVVVFVIVAATLAASARRIDMLLISNAGLERERANLSRYFSPTVVEELSHNDEPLKQIRTHDVAVLFIDIVDFTSFAATREPREVIELLRGFHGRMESEVFRFDGTLDKYLGDGLMATFGTPFAGENDATRALGCARAMTVAMEQWNDERRRAGEPEINIGIGVHYGPVVLGDIGANRLEFAVIGNTVNVSSRLEALTRSLKVRLIISDALRDQVLREANPFLEGFECIPDQEIRGISEPLTVWTLK